MTSPRLDPVTHTAPPPSFEVLRLQYLDEVEEQLSVLSRDLEQGLGGVSNRDPEGRFRKLVHNLKGSGGGYEFPELSRRAGALERAFFARADLPELRSKLEAMADAVHQGRALVTQVAPERALGVLLVDDDHLVATLVRHALSAYVTEQAGSCAEALLRLSRTPKVDVVILDQHLPDGLGLELIAPIRSLAPEVRVVLSTADSRRLEARALEAGADAVLGKPFSINDLQSVVQGVFRSGG